MIHKKLVRYFFYFAFALLFNGSSECLSNQNTNAVLCIHEHELTTQSDYKKYEEQITNVLQNLKIPGLKKVYLLKGFKGERIYKYAILWIFESKEAITRNFGTLDCPKWPEEWLNYENNILAPFLDRPPDTITFTDYEIVVNNKYPDF